MAPREANNPYPDQYLTLEYDATAMMMPHDTGGPAINEGENNADIGVDVDVDIDDLLPMPQQQNQQQTQQQQQQNQQQTQQQLPVTANANTMIAAAAAAVADIDVDDSSEEEDDDDQSDVDDDDEDDGIGIDAINMGMGINMNLTPQPPTEVLLPATTPLPTNLAMGDSNAHGTGTSNNQANTSMSGSGSGTTNGHSTATNTRPLNRHQQRAAWAAVHRNNRPGHPNHGHSHNRPNRPSQNRNALMSVGSDLNQSDIDPLAIDMTDPDEEETWNRTHAMFVEAAMVSSQMSSNSNSLLSSSFSNPNSPTIRMSRSSRSRGSGGNGNANSNSNANGTIPPSFSPASRQVSSDSIDTPQSRRRASSYSSASFGPAQVVQGIPVQGRGSLVSPTPGDNQGTNANTNNNNNTNSRIFSIPTNSSLPLPSRNNNNNNGNGSLNLSASHRRRILHRNSLSSVLDHDPSISDDEQDDNDNNIQGSNGGLPDLDTTLDTSDTSSAPNTPLASNNWDFVESSSNIAASASAIPLASTSGSASGSGSDLTNPVSRFTLSPVRRLIRGERNPFHNSNNNPNQSQNHINVVTDEETNSPAPVVSPGPFNHAIGEFASTPSTSPQPQSIHGLGDIDLPPSPRRLVSNSSIGHVARSTSINSSASGRSIRWTPAFESGLASANFSDSSSVSGSAVGPGSSSSFGNGSVQNNSNNQINFSFGSNTNVADLKYFAERGCIVHLLRALDSPRLKTLGTRMLADYAKIPHRRVAVASNRRILEFCCRTMLEMPSADNMGTEWPAREYAVETIRSLTATEDSDSFLMGCTGLLKALAIVVRGGPFYDIHNVATVDTPLPHMYNCDTTLNMGLVSGKARLHACIAIMNLSCGKANKIEIASIPEVLEAMRDVMIAIPEHFSPATSSPPVPNTSSSTATPKSVSDEARLKAATCIKNLSNADANDGSLLRAKGLIEALAHAAVITCSAEKGATHCTTNACLAMMNLSISKANKHRVFKTKGVMDSLMTVLARTSSTDRRSRSNSNSEARVKACSALSNLAIGYENKIPMFNYDGFVDAILQVIETDTGEARTKACSILWSFAAEMKNQVPVVQRGDILPTLVRVAEEDHSTEARFKCVAALTLLAESLENALPLLESGALHPLMDILHEAGADPTQWKGQTASWCVGFLMNMAQSDDAAPFLREAGVVELLAPLLTLEHYQSLKAAMAVTFICRFDEDDETYDLLRKTENVIPKIISLLHNTLSGSGGSGYKYGVFTLRSSVGCISSLASGPEFMKERIATKPVFESLLRVVTDFCVNGGTKGAIVGGGRDDALSATLAIRALHSLTEYMIPIPGSSALPFGAIMDKKLMVALESFSQCTNSEIKRETLELATDGYNRINKSLGLDQCTEEDSGSEGFIPRRTVASNLIENSIVASWVQGCCIGPSLHSGDDGGFFPSMIRRPLSQPAPVAEISDASDVSDDTESGSTSSNGVVRTFLLPDSNTGRLFAVPRDPSGGRAFNDRRPWCYRRGRYCRAGEIPDPNFVWTEELQVTYSEALQSQRSSSDSQGSGSNSRASSTHGAPVASAVLK